jgi:hypothetical protein
VSAIYDGAGQLIAPGGGQYTAYAASMDSLLIDPVDSPATTPYVYRGAWNSNVSSVVKNYHSNWVGDIVHSGGASTGEHEGVVIDDNACITISGVTITWTILVEANAGDIFAGQGDSGGPVFRVLSNGVQARGIISSIKTNYATQTCPWKSSDSGNIVCSTRGNYIPISVILNTWGIALETG